MTRRKLLIVLLTSLLALVGGVYAYFRGKRYVFTFTEAQLRETLSFLDGKQAAAKLLLKDVATRDQKLFVTLGL